MIYSLSQNDKQINYTFLLFRCNWLLSAFFDIVSYIPLHASHAISVLHVADSGQLLWDFLGLRGLPMNSTKWVVDE